MVGTLRYFVHIVYPAELLSSPQRIMFRYLLLICILLPVWATAQIVEISGHRGVADHVTHRVLFSHTEEEAEHCDLPLNIVLENEEYEVTTTTLPLIHLKEAQFSQDEFTPSVLSIIYPEDSVASYPILIRHRGASAMVYDKKNYSVKLLDADGNDLDVPLLGLRNDNSWILDAMAVDLARMRNRVSMDFWLDFSARPYYAETREPKMINGTRGKFVEVFLGDRYWGLYCLNEKVDRKQLKLKKFVAPDQPRGILYKSYKYDNLLKITDPHPDNTSFTWQGWEGAYPDVRKGEPFDWGPLFDFATIVSSYPDGSDYIKENLRFIADLPVWCDYELFCDLLMASDNACKNQYLYYRDITASPAEPLGICPWDLDATWGQDWRHQHKSAHDNCVVAPAVLYHIYFTQPECGVSFENRWAELRETYFDPDVIRPYFQRYFDLFATSGADRRETERWSGVNGVTLDFQAEAKYISQWIEDRINYLDNDYQYHRQGIGDIVSDNAAPLPVYSLTGTVVATCTTPSEVHRMGLPAGIYIVAGKKIAVR